MFRVPAFWSAMVVPPVRPNFPDLFSVIGFMPMSKRMFFVVAGCLVFGYLLWAGMSLRHQETAEPQTVALTSAPDFSLPDLNGNTVTLSEQRGKVVLMVFWATWCPPCRQEMPSINRLYQTLGGVDFTVLGINMDKRVPQVKTFASAKGYNLTFPILLDMDGQVAGLYGVYNIPQAFIIDKNGSVVQRYLGYYDWSSEQSLNKIRSLTGKP